MSFLNKIIFYLFLSFFLLFAHVWFHGMGVTGLGVQQNNISWIFVSIVISLSLFVVYKRKNLTLPKNWKWLVLGLGLMLIPFLFGEKRFVTDISSSLLVFGTLGVGGFFLALFQFNQFSERPYNILKLILVCISIQVAWGAYETLGAISYNIQANIIAYDPAPLGVFNQKNVFASFLVTGLGVSLYLNSFKENKFYEAIWYNSFALIAVFILIFSNSRVGYIGAVFSIILILPFALKQRRLYAFFWLVSAIIGLGAALYVLGDMGSVEKEMAKDGSRMGIYFTSLHSIIDAPIVGHGLGSFEGVFLEKYGDLHQKGMLPVGSSQGTITHPHNEFLYWGIQGGMISIIGIIVLIVSLLGSLPVKKQLVKWLASIALLVPITLHAMVEMPFYQSVLHLIVVIAIYVSVYHILNDKTEAVNVYEIKKCSLLLPVLPSLALGSLTVVFFMNITSLNTFHVFINQKERSLTLLEDIGVTIGWDKTYQHVYLATISQVGIQQSRPELSEPYIKWAEETISKSPKLDYFITLVYAYESTGQRDKALDAVRLFDYYYPTHKPAQDWISSYYSKVIGKTSPDR